MQNKSRRAQLYTDPRVAWIQAGLPNCSRMNGTGTRRRGVTTHMRTDCHCVTITGSKNSV